MSPTIIWSRCSPASSLEAVAGGGNASFVYVASLGCARPALRSRHSCSGGEAVAARHRVPRALFFGLVLSVRILDRIRRYLHREKSRGVDPERVAAAEP